MEEGERAQLKQELEEFVKRFNGKAHVQDNFITGKSFGKLVKWCVKKYGSAPDGWADRAEQARTQPQTQPRKQPGGSNADAEEPQLARKGPPREGPPCAWQAEYDVILDDRRIGACTRTMQALEVALARRPLPDVCLFNAAISACAWAKR